MGAQLSTLDNPFNPFEDFKEWYRFDMQNNYDTCGLMARIAPGTSEVLPDYLTDSLQLEAFKRIVKLMPNIYWIVYDNMSSEEFTRVSNNNKKLFKQFKESE